MPKPPKGTLPAFAPVPRLADRSNGWKPEVQRAFIEALAETGSVQAACRRVDRSDNSAYQLRRHPEAREFRKAWEAALALGVQRIEDVAMDRALNGVEVPVYSYGKLVGTRIIYNDRLLMFILRNRAPARFAEGKPKALNAVGRMELTRLRNQWRKQWERERGAEQLKQEVATMASINAKIDLLRAKEEAIESPRVRALRDAYEDAIEQAREEDAKNRYNPYADPEHELYRGDPPARAGDPGGADFGIVLYDTDEEADNAGLVFNGPLLPAPRDSAGASAQAPKDRGGPRIYTLKGEWD